MNDATVHRFDVILVWKLDRFGRSVLNLSERLAALSFYGIRFIATSQGLDTDQGNPASRLLLPILAAKVEFEREMIRERVKAGMAAAKHKGTWLGRPKVALDQKRVRKLHKPGFSQRPSPRRWASEKARSPAS